MEQYLLKICIQKFIKKKYKEILLKRNIYICRYINVKKYVKKILFRYKCKNVKIINYQ